MIQELKIKNYLSIKDEITISFDASNDPFAEDYQVVKINDQTKLLRFAVVYGYNASGKSNIYDAFCFLGMFFRIKPTSFNENTGALPFKFDPISREQPSSFELTFFVGNTKYKYSLEVDEKQVYSESLSVYNSSQPTSLFKRSLNGEQSKIDINPKLKVSKNAKEALEVNCLKNMSFFAARDQVNGKFPYIDDAREWLVKHLKRPIDKNTDLMYYAKKKLRDNDDMKKYTLEMLKKADFNISDIGIEEEYFSEDVTKQLLSSGLMPIGMIKKIENKERFSHLKATFHHSVENGGKSQVYSLDEEIESLGTLRLIGLNVALYEAEKDEGFLAIDEIENSLHPDLLQGLLYNFLKNNSRSQLFVTTHNDGLLDLTDDLIRKDSVWFVEKNKAGVSDYYKLTDFKGVNRISSIRSAYRNKRFGATQFSVK